MARPKKKKEVKLIEQEIKKMNIYKAHIDQAYAQLGSVRKQFLIQEKKALEAIKDAESELLSYMKKVAEDKDIPNDEEWNFDLTKNKFIKQE